MVLDNIEGVPLRTYLARHSRLPIEDVVRIGIQPSETLEYVRSQGVIQRDLKPDNVLIGPLAEWRSPTLGLRCGWSSGG